MAADPVRGEEFAHGLGDPQQVANLLQHAGSVAMPEAHIVSVPGELLLQPTEVDFSQVVLGATRWTRA